MKWPAGATIQELRGNLRERRECGSWQRLTTFGSLVRLSSHHHCHSRPAARRRRFQVPLCNDNSSTGSAWGAAAIGATAGQRESGDGRRIRVMGGRAVLQAAYPGFQGN